MNNILSLYFSIPSLIIACLTTLFIFHVSKTKINSEDEKWKKLNQYISPMGYLKFSIFLGIIYPITIVWLLINIIKEIINDNGPVA